MPKVKTFIGLVRGPKGDIGAQGPKGDTGERGPKGDIGDSGVHFGANTPPASANVWVDPNGTPSGTEEWTFTLEDGTVVKKTVVVVG